MRDFFLLARDRALTEDQKAALHAALVDHYSGAQVQARTIDLGGADCLGKDRNTAACGINGPLRPSPGLPPSPGLLDIFKTLTRRDDMQYAFRSQIE